MENHSESNLIFWRQIHLGESQQNMTKSSCNTSIATTLDFDTHRFQTSHHQSCVSFHIHRNVKFINLLERVDNILGLVMGLLNPNPEKRFTSEDIQSDHWFGRYGLSTTVFCELSLCNMLTFNMRLIRPFKAKPDVDRR
jgi:hypothetical protein